MTSTLLDTRFRTLDGVQVRYADGAGKREPAILLTSAWPESLHAFAPIWWTLSQHARLVAVDLPGFGRSDYRQDLMSPRAMGSFLVRVVEEADLGTPYVVGPDVGTPTALFAAADPPRSVRRPGGRRRCGRLPARARRTSFLLGARPGPREVPAAGPHAVVNTAVDNIAGDVPEVRADYLASYEGSRVVESMRCVRRYPQELHAWESHH
jgi:pimeloyl-ACP methyl ester carboxylesterase